VVLGQVATADHSNEITAIPVLLQLLDVRGATVTIDAAGCQKEIARQVRAQGADFVLAVKGNQKNLEEAVQFQLGRGHSQVARSKLTTREKSHGRKEQRRRCVTLLAHDALGVWPVARHGARRCHGGVGTVSPEAALATSKGKEPDTADEPLRLVTMSMLGTQRSSRASS
jgi:predicted transposase YbfD/YdcC